MKRIIFFAEEELIKSYQESRKANIFNVLIDKFKQELEEDVKSVNLKQDILTMDIDCDESNSNEDISGFICNAIDCNEQELAQVNISVINIAQDSDSSYNEELKQAHRGQDFNAYVEVVNELQQELSHKVLGQNYAIKEITSGLLNAEINYSENNTYPLAVLTFLGPHGVGKTLAANYIAHFFADKIKKPFCIFNRSDYENEDFNKDLTSFVYSNPESIVVFNDAEDLYKYISEMLREVFLSGAYHDVSFRKTIFIFTTCLGETLYSNSFTGNLSHYTPDALMKVLESEKLENSNIGCFSPYVVQGLAKGKMIMFNYLEPVILKKIVQKEIEESFNNFTEKTNIAIKYNKKQLTDALLYMNDSDYNANAIKEYIKRFLDKELVNIFSEVNPETNKPILASLETIKYNLVLNHVPDNVKELFSEREQNILVICPTEKAEFFKNCSIKHVNLHLASTMDEAKSLLRENIDGILLDVLLNEKKMDYIPTNLAGYDSDGMLLYHFIATYYNNIPLYLLSDKRDNISSHRYNSFLNGIAKDVIYYDIHNPKKFEGEVNEIQAGLELFSDITRLNKENKKLAYNSLQVLSNDQNTLTIMMKDLTLDYCQRNLNSKLFQSYTSNIRFKDIIGNENAIDILKYYSGLLVEYSFFRKNGLKAPRGLLLYGDEGTGKTLMAQAVANETNSLFLQYSLSDVLMKVKYSTDDFIDEIHNIFKQAKASSPAVLLVKDIDELFGDGTGPTNARKAFVTEMENLNSDEKHPVLLIGLTHCDKEDIDDYEYFIKHFDRSIGIFRPDEKERETFIKKYLEDRHIKTLSADIIHNFAVRTLGRTFTHIESVLELLIRNSQGQTITDKMLVDCIDLYDGGEVRAFKDESEELRIAYHEMGHYLIDYLNGNKPSFVTIVSRGDYGGYTSIDRHEDRFNYTRQNYLDDICCLFGGRAAEFVAYGEDGITDGISGDLEMATRKARIIITYFGMGEHLYSLAGLYHKELPDEMLAEIDSILHTQYDRALQLLRDNRDKLDLLAHELMAKKSLTSVDIEKLLK